MTHQAYDAIPEVGLLYDAVPLYAARGDAAFYAEEASRARGPVLELGCGTGRVLLPIAQAGIDITGLDPSRPMLDRLRSKPGAERLTLHEADARNFALGKRFALITAPFRVIQHLPAVDDQLRLLDSVTRHLAPGGRFIFDVFNPRFSALTSDRTAETEDTPELTMADGRRFRRAAAVKNVRWIDQVSEVELVYYVNSERYVQAFDMRWYTKVELEHLLARAGFTVEAVYGDFARGALTDASPEQVWVTTRQ